MRDMASDGAAGGQGGQDGGDEARRIVVVEDDVVTRMAIVDSLGELGLDVAEAADAPAFVALLQDSVHPADILMVDVNLGGGPSGFDLARLARERWPDVAVVYITGDLRAVVKTSGQADLCLLKPFSERALHQLVRSIPVLRK